MSKAADIIKSINQILKDESVDIKEYLPDSPGVDELQHYIDDYEKGIAKLLRNQKKYILDSINSFLAKDDETKLVSLLNHLAIGGFIDNDEFEKLMTILTSDFLKLTISDLSAIIMKAIDPDIPFSTLSNKTLKWINYWSENLAHLMNLNTYKDLEKALSESIENGESISKTTAKISKLDAFSRTRAEATAQTEILTAFSQSQLESYNQSPAVTSKKWKHSGAKKNKPRPTHVALDGTVVALDQKFIVGGYEADCPRDISLPASERVRCHCALGPVIDENILGLSKEEKESIRQQAINEI